MTLPITPATTFDGLEQAIRGYFEQLTLPEGLGAEDVLSYLRQLQADGASVPGLAAAWTDLELFCAYLEHLDTDRRLDALEPWEFSSFLFEFLEKEVFEPQARQADRKRQLMSTVAGLMAHLALKGAVQSAGTAGEALRRIFAGKSPRRIGRPAMSAGERIGFLNGPSTGVSHEIHGADLWLAAVRDADFEGQWKGLIEHLDLHAIPDSEKKRAAARRLATIRELDELDPLDLMGAQSVTKKFLTRARKFVYGEDYPRVD
ncbi:MAG: hypothetical protein HY814_01760 [Candidatus Riflebacteria bacterium]|nr:hypothetical protein [Candidatus Riflebacteria bacterium]